MGEQFKITKCYINIKCGQNYYSISGLVFLIWPMELRVINFWLYDTYVGIGVVQLSGVFFSLIWSPTKERAHPQRIAPPFFYSDMTLLSWLKGEGRTTSFDLVIVTLRSWEADFFIRCAFSLSAPYNTRGYYVF